MEITVNEIEAIVKTLPIGFYAKKNFKVAIDKEADTSYFNMVTEEIMISPSIIQKGFETIDDSLIEKKESLIRDMVYHELSHAILTPRNMNSRDIYNIFEDERIETLLRDYYLDVNFKEQLYLINGMTESALPTPTDGLDAFYQIVRYRHGEDKFVKRVSNIIKKYASLSAYSDDTWASRSKTYDYEDEIRDLYDDICTTYGIPPRGKSLKQMLKDMIKNSTEDDSSSIGKGGAETLEITSDNEDSSLSAEDSKNPCHGQMKDIKLTSDKVDKILDNICRTEQKKEFAKPLEMIFDNFKRKNNSGSGINAYSGIFNPRNVVRTDYKYFDKSLSVNGNNKFGSCHLNLFIDCSGSFYENETIVNTLLSSLTYIENKNPNFSLDVVFCGEGEKIALAKRDRAIKCFGGNDLNNEIFEIVKKLQKKNTFNYNIALFDGDAFSDTSRTCSYFGKTFKAFDMNNSTIISDYDNESYIKNTVKSAKVIYTHDYADELIKNVMSTLTNAFR